MNYVKHQRSVVAAAAQLTDRQSTLFIAACASRLVDFAMRTKAAISAVDLATIQRCQAVIQYCLETVVRSNGSAAELQCRFEALNAQMDDDDSGGALPDLVLENLKFIALYCLAVQLKNTENPVEAVTNSMLEAFGYAQEDDSYRLITDQELEAALSAEAVWQLEALASYQQV